MGIASSTVSVTQSEGWKLVLSGDGTLQVQGSAVVLVKLSGTLPTDDSGAFEKYPGGEVMNGDSTVSAYAKVRGALDTGIIAAWTVV
jgi:hypothetical protein